MKTCASLFSGCGGWEVGAVMAGYTPLWAVEVDAKIAQVHRDNFPESQVINDSVTAVSDEQIAYLPVPDVLFASPPCQAHSVNRSKKLAPRDDADVGLDVLRWVRIQRPAHVLVENVQGYRRSEAFYGLVQGLGELGYACAFQVYDAADFGVPQHRKRLILHASRVGLPTLPQPTGPLVGWYEAIKDLIPALPATRTTIALPECRSLPRLLDRKQTSTTKHGRARNFRVAPLPAFTMLATITAPPAVVLVDRVLACTPRAIARLCSFPDSYQLPDDKKTAYKVLGNAVPPLMARGVVAALG